MVNNQWNMINIDIQYGNLKIDGTIHSNLWIIA